MRTAFEVGVVLLAKDMYSKVVAKAERDLSVLRNVSQKSADEFTKSFNQAKKIGAIGLGITAAGVAMTNFMKGALEAAGESESAIGRVLTDMGESANVSKEMIKKAFTEIKTTWGMTDDEISDSMRAAGGRFGDYAKGIEATSIAAVLATARSIDLGSATNMLTTTFMQFGDRMNKGLSNEEKMIGTGNVLSEVIKRLGGNWEGLNLYLGSTSIKAKSAGQSMETVLATAAILGQDAVKLKMGGAAMDNILDTMTKLRGKAPGLVGLMPKFQKTNDFVDFLSDMKGAMATLGIKDTRQQLNFLTRYFGSSADMVQYFMDKLEDLKAQKKTLEDLSKETSKTSSIFRDAEGNAKTWAQQQKILEGRIDELKDAIGAGLLPLTEKLYDIFGKVATWLSKNKLAAGILGVSGAVIGIGGAIATIAGPLMTMIGTFKMWKVSTDLAKIATMGLNRESILGGAPMKNLSLNAITPMTKLSDATKTMSGRLQTMGAVATAAFIGWEIGTLLRQIPGLDNAVQNLFATLTGTNMGDEVEKEMVKAEAAVNKFKKGLKLTDEEKKTLVLFHWAAASQAGNKMSPESFVKWMGRLGIDEGFVGETISKEREKKQMRVTGRSNWLSSALLEPLGLYGTGYKAEEKYKAFPSPAVIGGTSGGSTIPIPGHQAGTARVNRTGLAIVHEGEEIRNKSMANRSGGGNISFGDIHIHLTSTGSMTMDAKNMARLVKIEIDRMLKAEARRF